MEWQEYFKGKKITLMGLGVLGRGVGDALFLARAGAEVLVTDMKSEEDLATSVSKLKDTPGITLRLGGHDMSDFTHCDLVVKSASVPLDSPYIAEAKKHNIPVSMSSALFARFANIPIVGVTGTRGKSTVTHMIHHMLTSVGRKSLLGGNIRGVSTLSFLPEIDQYEYAVLELDSWQLQGFHEEKISPHVGVFTSFMPDHMNYYKNDLDAYFYDKSAIFQYQNAQDVFVVNPDIQEYFNTSKYEAHYKRAHIVDVGSIDASTLKLYGEHNRINTACALEAVCSLGIAREVAQQHIASFSGVEGRLQSMGMVSGLEVVNDNNATTPDAVIAGLNAFAGKQITLLCGGADKGLSLDELAQAINTNVHTVVLLSGSGTERLKPLLAVPYSEFQTLRDCVDYVFENQSEGVFLFSPGFASFSTEFKNEYERNDVFVEYIKNKKGTA